MKEQDSKYYDKIYRESASYAASYKDSPYYKLWQRLIPLVIVSGASNIFEIGCGPGQFARMLLDNTRNINYSGIDFSEIAIEKAKMNIPEFKHSIQCQDVYTFHIPPGNLILALEVLEHVDDIKVLESIPYGSPIIFTVPDFDDPAHVRYFNDLEEIKERYRHNIDFTFMEKHERWFICTGVIK